MIFANEKQINDLYLFCKYFGVKNHDLEVQLGLHKGCLSHQITKTEKARPMNIERYNMLVEFLKEKYTFDSFEGRVLRTVVTGEYLDNAYNAGFIAGISKASKSIEALVQNNFD